MITEKVFAITDEAMLDVLLHILDTAKGPDLLNAVHAVVGNADIPPDWYEQMKGDEKAAIRLSREELAAGKVIAHEDLMNEIMAWAKK